MLLLNKNTKTFDILERYSFEKNQCKTPFNNSSIFQTKSPDTFIFKLQEKKYNQISLYLNDKYGKKKSHSFHISKKKLKIYITESYNKKIRKWFLADNLKDMFDIEYVDENPDYIIIDVFGYRNKTFNSSIINKAIKIGIFTENKIPDLNEFDYALGQSHIN